MSFEDLDEFFDDTIELPVGGKTYVVPGVDAETGLYCQRLLERGKAAYLGKDVDGGELDDEAEMSLYERVLGPVYAELIADGVSWPKISHCGLTAFFWAANNRTTAEKYWNSGGNPEALTPPTNRAQRRASGSRTKAGGAAVNTSKTRASMSGTKTRASRGGKSLPTGH